MDATKPIVPTVISALLPRLSDSRAHLGAVITQSKADQLKARLTQKSGTSSWLAIAGSADCIAVFPAAETSMTRNRIATRSEGIEAGVMLTQGLAQS